MKKRLSKKNRKLYNNFIRYKIQRLFAILMIFVCIMTFMPISDCLAAVHMNECIFNSMNIRNGLINWVQPKTIYNKNIKIKDKNINIDGDIYCGNEWKIDSKNLKFNGSVIAKDDITIKTKELTTDKLTVIYSENGNIDIKAEKLNFYGIIYAPKGTVKINGKKVELKGKILGKKVKSNLKLQIQKDYQVEEYLKEWSIYECTFQPQLSVVYKDGKIKMSWTDDEKIILSDIYVRLNDDDKFSFIGASKLNEYEFKQEDFYKCDFRIVSELYYGEKYTSNIVTLFYEDGILYEDEIDSDKDKIPDGYEIWDLRSDPNNKDTDRDGIDDGYEVLILYSDPLKVDSNKDADKDGMTNLEEYKNGTHPLLKDTDFDGIMDKKDEEPTKPIKGKYTVYDNILLHQKGKFDIVNHYIQDGVEYQSVYNFLNQETMYNKIGDEILYKYLDRKYNTQVEVRQYLNRKLDSIDAVVYEYFDDNMLKRITENGVSYSFQYDDAHCMTECYLNDQQLLNYDYEKNNIKKMSLANGSEESYVYDKEGNIIERYEDCQLVGKYEYDSKGNLIQSNDMKNDSTIKYTYNNGIISSFCVNDELTVEYSYDENLARCSVNILGQKWEQETKYQDNKYNMELISDDQYSFEKIDDITYQEQVKKDGKLIYSNIYTRSSMEEENFHILEMIKSNGDIYEYTYNPIGNITSININGQKVKSYEYNSKNELIKESNHKNNEIRSYQYNQRGNIISSDISFDKNDSKAINLHKFQYNNEDWLDLISIADGNKIKYDEIGNPLNYRNGWKFTWSKGSLLESAQNKNTLIEYTYNDMGIRVEKNVNGIKTQYITEGSKILGTKTGEVLIWYIYNGADDVIGFIYDDKTYYFEKDIFNSVVSILNEDSKQVCTYEYDAWGNTVNISGDVQLAGLNIFRYEGYIFDEETGFYYLQSRYYDPQSYRFINADSIFSGTNLFRYCENNPTNYCDPNGYNPVGAAIKGNNAIYVSGYGFSGVSYQIVNSNSNLFSGGFFYSKTLNNKVYFNCYMWALHKYTMAFNSIKNPGQYANLSSSLPSMFTVGEILEKVKLDLSKLGWKYKAASSPTQAVGNNQRLIALRTTTKGSSYYKKTGGWDYHFMRKIGNIWTYKAGKAGRIMELASGNTPSNTTWDMCSWDTKISRWCVTYSDAYTSKIKYFIITIQ